MSLQFIMGPSGSGKSHYLYQWVTKESFKHPKKKYIVLVPEQFTMQTQKDLVMASPRKGILNVEVLSFHRLAQRVFEETGENHRTILDDVGKNFVIRKIAGEQGEELKVIGSNLRKVGYISEVKSIISEFTQYNIQPEHLGEMMEQMKKNPNLYYKLSDLKVVYESFRDYLKEKYITGEEVLDVLSSVAHKSKLLRDSVIVLDGFTGFTPVQNKLLSTLMSLCEEVLLTVTMDKSENPFIYQHPYQLFALSKQMVVTLVHMAEENKVEVKRPIYLFEEPVYRFCDNRPLAFMESRLFRYGNKSFEEEQDAIQVWCAKNPREEMDFVAQKIRYLVRTGQCRYQDIAILTSALDCYASHIERSFEQYEIPVFMDHKRSILLNSCVEYIRSLLVMAEQNFTYESVFRYLRTGLVGIHCDEIDVLENYVLALGIQGYKKWQEKWVRRTRKMSVEELDKINDTREKIINCLEPVMAVLKSRKKTVLDVTRALHSFFLQNELQLHVKEYQLKFEAEGELALAKEYAQVYRIVIELLDQFVELLGDETISLKEYCELLDAGLEEAKVGVIPPSLDQVMVGDVERSRIKDVKVVFLVGVSDNHLPGSMSGGGFLTEYDRQMLTETGTVLAPGTKEKIYIQKFYLYLILTKPTNQVYLTYSKSNSDGNSSRPSYLVTEIVKLFPKLCVQNVPSEIRKKEFTPQSGVASLIEGLQQRENGLNVEWQELYTWYKKQEEWQEKIDRILEATFYENPNHTLTRETAKQLYGDVLDNSVTRLEKFSKCAYSHFLSYGLRLREREEYQFQGLDFGTLFHSSIEKFSRKVEKSEWSWTDLPEQSQEELIQQSVEESVVDYGNSILYSSARNEYMILRLKRLLRRTVWAMRQQLQKGDFVPDGYEVVFNYLKGLRLSNVDLGELGKLRLNGKIDRVDVCEDEQNVYVKIVDYKTDTTKFDWSELCHGLQIQLFVYMKAAMELQAMKSPDKQIVPAGALYYGAVDPIVSDQNDLEKVETEILKSLKPLGVIQNDETIVCHLDREFTKSSQVIPVARDKEGAIKATDAVVTAEEFELVGDYIEHQIQKIGKQILEGQAEIAPHKLGSHTGCEYCPYQSVCGFEEKVPGYQYRELEKMDKQKAVEKMREEVDTWELNLQENNSK